MTILHKQYKIKIHKIYSHDILKHDKIYKISSHDILKTIQNTQKIFIRYKIHKIYIRYIIHKL